MPLNERRGDLPLPSDHSDRLVKQALFAVAGILDARRSGIRVAKLAMMVPVITSGDGRDTPYPLTMPLRPLSVPDERNVGR